MKESDNFTFNPFDASSFIGTISEAASSTVVVELGQPNAFSADQPSGIQVGQFAVISCDNFAIFGKILSLFSHNSDRPQRVIPQAAKLQLLASLDITIGCIYPGVVSHPRVGDQVFLADSDLLLLFTGTLDRFSEEEQPVRLNIAYMGATSETPLVVTPEMLFGRHCALFGSTGSGKSWSIARILEELARYRGKVILFDATGEFSSMRKGVKHLYFGRDPHPPQGAIEVSLPYFELTESDLFAIFKPSGQSQSPKLRSAIKSLKLAILAPELTYDGTIIKADRSKDAFESAYRKHYREVEDSVARFNIRKLPRQIENECVKPTRSALEQNIWGDYQGAEISRCVPLIARIQDIIQSSELSPIFDPQDRPSLVRELDYFLNDPTSHILRVSLQYLSFAHNTREIVANAIGRHLLQMARRGRFQKAPLLVVLDEAHQFLNLSFNNETDTFALDSFALIAKEGRKYSLNICLATQRPRDIPEGVLSQLNTMIVHRVINDQDRKIIERASSEIDDASISALPSLSPGEAVLVGVEFPIPLVVRIAAPTYPPESRGPDYQKYWK